MAETKYFNLQNLKIFTTLLPVAKVTCEHALNMLNYDSLAILY